MRGLSSAGKIIVGSMVMGMVGCVGVISQQGTGEHINTILVNIIIVLITMHYIWLMIHFQSLSKITLSVGWEGVCGSSG